MERVWLWPRERVEEVQNCRLRMADRVESDTGPDDEMTMMVEWPVRVWTGTPCGGRWKSGSAWPSGCASRFRSSARGSWPR